MRGRGNKGPKRGDNRRGQGGRGRGTSRGDKGERKTSGNKGSPLANHIMSGGPFTEAYSDVLRRLMLEEGVTTKHLGLSMIRLMNNPEDKDHVDRTTEAILEGILETSPKEDLGYKNNMMLTQCCLFGLRRTTMFLLRKCKDNNIDPFAGDCVNIYNLMMVGDFKAMAYILCKAEELRVPSDEKYKSVVSWISERKREGCDDDDIKCHVVMEGLTYVVKRVMKRIQDSGETVTYKDWFSQFFRFCEALDGEEGIGMTLVKHLFKLPTCMCFYLRAFNHSPSVQTPRLLVILRYFYPSVIGMDLMMPDVMKFTDSITTENKQVLADIRVFCEADEGLLFSMMEHFMRAGNISLFRYAASSYVSDGRWGVNQEKVNRYYEVWDNLATPFMFTLFGRSQEVEVNTEWE
jgi:hypothetical protein